MTKFAYVKKALSSFIAILLLSQSMNIYPLDLLKVDEIVEHAIYHQEEFGDNWFTFFQKHLGSDSEKHLEHEHQEEHDKLPLHENLCSTVLPTVILEEQTEPFHFFHQVPQQKGIVAYIEHYSFLSQIDIFQPPRHA